MIENVSLWFAAIEVMDFNASNGGVLGVQIWPIVTFEFSCDNSGSDLRGLLLTCSVCVNPLRVYWSELVLCNVFTFIDFLIHSNVTWICQLLFKSFAHCMPRQFFAGNVINAYDVL